MHRVCPVAWGIRVFEEKEEKMEDQEKPAFVGRMEKLVLLDHRDQLDFLVKQELMAQMDCQETRDPRVNEEQMAHPVQRVFLDFLEDLVLVVLKDSGEAAVRWELPELMAKKEKRAWMVLQELLAPLGFQAQRDKTVVLDFLDEEENEETRDLVEHQVPLVSLGRLE